jgi:hypothetical protein
MEGLALILLTGTGLIDDDDDDDDTCTRLTD